MMLLMFAGVILFCFSAVLLVGSVYILILLIKETMKEIEEWKNESKDIQ